MFRFIKVLLLLSLALPLYSFDFVIIKYKSGDYYNAREGVKNFLMELKKRTGIDVNETAVELSLDDDAVFQHYFLFINGHVPIGLSAAEGANLRKFVLNGGFVYANDDYGMDESFRKALKEIFPDYPLQEVDFGNPIYHSFYELKEGVPKIHEHYEGAPKAYGLFMNGRIALYYTYNSDIPDGWDPPEVHNDPVSKREEAFRMGVNLVVYSLTH
jgi:hypothetical protein